MAEENKTPMFKDERRNDKLYNKNNNRRKKKNKNKAPYAEAVALHSVTEGYTPSSFLNDVNAYSDPSLEDRARNIALCRKLRSVEGICSSVIDLQIDFLVTDGSYRSDNQELQILLNDWTSRVNSVPILSKKTTIIPPVPGLRVFLRKISDDYLTDGDAVFSLFWENGVKLKEQGDSYFLPMTLKHLNTLTLTADADLAKLGFEQLTLELDRTIQQRILKPTSDADKQMIKILPPEWVKAIKAKEPIVLDPAVTFHLKRNAKDYKAWGESYLVKAFGAVAAKRRLQAVDAAIIDGLINRITVFKVGLPDKEKNPAYHTPSKRRIDQLVSLLTDPKRMNTIVWPGPDLEIDDITPDADILKFNDKYKQADVDILRALKMSPILIDGGGTQDAMTDWLAVLGTEVGLNTVRAELESVLTVIGRTIAEANGLEYETLYYKFNTLLLKDEKTVRKYAIQLYELGALPVEELLNITGYNFEMMKYLKQKEKDEGIDQLFVNPNVPGFTNVDQNINDEGRPDDTPQDNAPAAAASDDAVGFYHRTFLAVFMGLKTGVTSIEAFDNDNHDMARMVITTHFDRLKKLMDNEIKATFKKASTGLINDDLTYVINWNASYLSNFYDSFVAEFMNTPKEIDRLTEKYTYRLFQYAREIYKKSLVGGQIAKARYQGIREGRVVCPETSTCSFSQDKNKKYGLDYLLANFPSHPGCNCAINFEKE